MAGPNLPNIDNIPPTEILSVSRGKIMSNYGSLSAGATETSAGLVELATSGEVLAGVDDCRVITPATLNTYVATNSGTWNSNAFTDLIDVSATPFDASVSGYIPVVAEVSPGVYALEMSPASFTVEDSQICLNSDTASVDTNFNLPSLASYPNASVSVVKVGTGTTVTLSPSGGDTIQGQTSAFISNNVLDAYSNIFLKGIGFNWTIMFGVGEWRPVISGETIPATDVDATPRYCDNDTITATVDSINQRDRTYVSETYPSSAAVSNYNTVANAWTDRRLNSLDSNPLNVVTSTDFGNYRFTLAAGTYRALVTATHRQHNGVTSQILFRLVTDPGADTLGVSNTVTFHQITAGSFAPDNSLTFSCEFTLDSPQLIKLQQFRSDATEPVFSNEILTTNSSGEPKILANIEFEKIR